MGYSCIICRELLLPSSEAFSTSCGHVFHHACLLQWIERSKTCPQCRYKTTEHTIHRIYFNVANTEEGEVDISTLHSQLDSLQFQLRVKDMDINKLKEENSKSKDVTSKLRKELRKLEDQEASSKTAIIMLKEQVSYFKSKGRDVEKLTDEVQNLKQKLRNMKSVQLVISSTKEEVDNMVRSNDDPKTLHLLICTLKKELVEMEKKYKQQSSIITNLNSDLSSLRKEIDELKKINNQLRETTSAHCTLEQDKFYKSKLIDLNIPVKKSSLDRIANNSTEVLFESPAPLRKTISLKETIEDDDKYLPIKSSSVAHLISPNVTKISKKTQQSTPDNIFKCSPTQLVALENFKSSRPDYNYNGLGGTSKDMIFPTPKLVNSKRKTSSSVSSSKFRKLAPHKRLES